MNNLRPLLAILACCGVKFVVLAALLAPAGFLTRNAWLAVLGVAVAAVLVSVSICRRRRCAGECHPPPPASERSARAPAKP